MSVGSRKATRRFKEELQSRFEIKTQVIGPDPSASRDYTGAETEGEDKIVQEGSVLNRVFRWTDDGWEIEPDQRHADIIVHELGLHESKPVSTPGEAECRSDDEDSTQPLDEQQATKYRALAARANYLARDRTDIMYAVKEICRQMASPTVGARKKLKRLGRYLKGNAMLAMRYPWQGEEKNIVGFSDSDWAGCRVTGKSTSGGALTIGSHLIKAWPHTQNHATLSSAEAELYAMVKCTAELVGVTEVMADW